MASSKVEQKLSLNRISPKVSTFTTLGASCRSCKIQDSTCFRMEDAHFSNGVKHPSCMLAPFD